jgi:deferrochelatase/peroxidase EfeB
VLELAGEERQPTASRALRSSSSLSSSNSISRAASRCVRRALWAIATIERVSGTRREFLAATGAAGIGATLAAGGAAAQSAAATDRSVPFHGVHQAGIATPTQEHVHFLALDVVSDSAAKLRALLARLSRAAAALTAGRPAGALDTGAAPPVDTGEAVGLQPSRLTITFGLGPTVFASGRFGLAGRRPAPLVTLPSFANDSLEAGISDGDIGVQACADDPQVAFHAIHDLIRLARPTAVARWSVAGFGRTLNTAGEPTPRNLMGFKDGTANIMRQDQAALERFVWAGAPESPVWMRGGSYMVVRRIQILLGEWDSISLDQQERTFGRHKLSGAPFGRNHEHDPLDLAALPLFSHVRLASPAYNGGQRILRRGYSYTDGLDQGAAAAGQLFICFQRDPRRQFIQIQTQLALADLLNQHTEHIGSAIFACPPGARPGGFVGEGLFG